MTTASELVGDTRVIRVYRGSKGRPEPKSWDPGNTILIEPHPTLERAREAILKLLDKIPETGLGYGIFFRESKVGRSRVDVFVACVWEVKDSGYTPGEEGLSKAGASVRERYGKSKVP